MLALRLTVPASELAGRMRERLRGPGAAPQSPSVVWQRDGQRVLIHLDSLSVHALDGWLVSTLDLQSDPTGRQRLQTVHYLGKEGEGDGLDAAARLSAPTPQAAQLAERWGADLHRVLWDAVLDVIEASLGHAAAQKPGERLTLQGFGCADNAVFVDVIAGEF